MSTSLYNVGGVALARPFKMGRLGHVGTFQADLEAARRFYVGELGFRLTDELTGGPDSPLLGFFTTHGTDHHTMVCINAALALAGDAAAYQGGLTINQISFQVGTLQEVMQGHAYFQQLGLKVWRVGRDAPGSNWAVYTLDPDGHFVELFYGMEQIGWDRRAKPVPARTLLNEAPVLPQPSEAEELRQVERSGTSLAGGFRPEEPQPYRFDVGGVMLQHPFKVNAVGPVYLFAKDLDRSLAFYRDIMGLALTEAVTWQGHRLLFLRSSHLHHVIGLFPEAARAALGVPGHNTTLAIGVELRSYQQLRQARQQLIEHGVPQAPALPQAVRPGIDHAAFFSDPAGHTVMLYSGMESIGWDGQPRPAEQRPVVGDAWPETLPESQAQFTCLQPGPMG
jgi:catechol 2,3-dioxygenase-like lactoylglutathione lyase family enzyme